MIRLSFLSSSRAHTAVNNRPILSIRAAMKSPLPGSLVRVMALTLAVASCVCGGAVSGQQAALEAKPADSSPKPDDAKIYAQRNSDNLAASKAIRGENNTDITTIKFDYNHIIFDGQSLSVGADSRISISTQQEHGNLMIGDNVAYDYNKEKVFSPLVTAVPPPNLPPGRNPDGEHPAIGATNFFKALYEKSPGSDPNRKFIASSCGISGKAIEQLSKGHPKQHQAWDRLVGSVQAAKEIASKEGKSYGVAALCWVQGESNYSPSGTFVCTKDEYKAKLRDFRAEFLKDAITGISGQPEVPAFVTYQTSGAYSNDTNGLAIGMAQWELTKEVPGCYLATPTYPFVDYGGHLTSNGYRWMGAQFGKVLDKVMVRREKWKPLSPRKIWQQGDRTLSIDFHVPQPPLVFDAPYIGRTKGPIPADKGFTIFDADGNVPIDSIRIVMDTIVEIVCKREFRGTPYVRYAAKFTYDGNGFLRDSDPAVSEDVYVYDASSKQGPDENIPELVGKPYPLFNWCIAFNLKAE